MRPSPGLPDGPLDAGAYEYGTGSPGYPRPKSAPTFRVSLTPAFNQCSSPNRQHGQPARLRLLQPAAVALHQADQSARPTRTARLRTPRARSSTGVLPRRREREGRDHGRAQAGDARRLHGRARRRAGCADHRSSQRPVAGSSRRPLSPIPFRFAVPCAATAATSVGSTCSLQSTLNAIVPGAVVDGQARGLGAERRRRL